MKSTNIPITAALLYLSVFLAVCVNHFFIALQSSPGPTVDIFPILVTMPWGIFMTYFMHSVGYVAWYSGFSSSSFLLYNFFAMLGLLPAALLNASLLFLMMKFIIGSRKSSK